MLIRGEVMNKNGWGLRAELAFLLLFLVCLLIATIGLHLMGLLGGDGGVYRNDDYIENNINFDYNSLEKKVTDAANQYYNVVYNSKTNDTLIVSTDTLKQYGYLTSIKDSIGRECKGYSIIMRTNNIVSYIKCTMYKTAGYSDEYE